MTSGKQKPTPIFQPNTNPVSNTRSGNYQRRPVDPISWGDIDNQLLRDAIVAATDCGAAILLSATSDRGALSVTILDGDNRVREWPHTAEETEAVLRWVVNMFAGN